MKKLNVLLTLALVAMFALTITSTSHVSAQADSAQVRVVHAAPDAGDVAVFADGSKTLDNFAYGKTSELMAVPAGTHKFQVAPAGKMAADAVITADGVTLEAGKHYTVFAIGTVKNNNLKLLAEVDDLSALAAGKARVRITHASEGSPNVDVYSNGTKIATDLAYGSFTDYLTVDTMSANIDIKAAGTDTVALNVPNVQVAAGKIYNFVAIGQLSNTTAPFTVLPIVDSAMSGSAMAEATPTAAMSDGSMTMNASVEADDQAAGSSLTVKRIVADQDGWITVHANDEKNQPGAQLGHTAVKKGENTNVVVELSPAPKAGDKVWPMLHIEAGTIGTYEFPGPDAPVIVNGNIIMKQITLTEAMMEMTPSITVNDQPYGASLTVEKVVAAQDGWVVVHNTGADGNFGATVLGKALVKAGETSNLKIDLDQTAVKAGDKVWPMLHIDVSTIGTYEFPGPDAPVIINGNIIMKQITLTGMMGGGETGTMPNLPKTGNGFDLTWLIALAALVISGGLFTRRLAVARARR